MKSNLQSTICQIKMVRFETIKTFPFPSRDPAENLWMQVGNSKGGPGGKHRLPGLDLGVRPGYNRGSIWGYDRGTIWENQGATGVRLGYDQGTTGVRLG